MERGKKRASPEGVLTGGPIRAQKGGEKVLYSTARRGKPWRRKDCRRSSSSFYLAEEDVDGRTTGVRNEEGRKEKKAGETSRPIVDW